MAPPILDQEPLINENAALQEYYASLESRIGYQLVLGGTRHFGYWEKDTYWPFPIDASLRAMEDHLYINLGLKDGSTVLDAGCGVGHVALHQASRGLKVQGVDVVEKHLEKAKRNIAAKGMEDMVEVRRMDYHHLDRFPDNSFDGAYTMETFVHTTDPELAASEFFRVIRPGGSLALYEYEHADMSTQSKATRDTWEKINKYGAMLAHNTFHNGTIKRVLEKVGFEDVKYDDISLNINPMVRLFYVLALIPYYIVWFFGLERWLINTVAGYQIYNSRGFSRYVAVSARKPAANEQIRRR